MDREELFQANKERLEELAYRAIARGMDSSEFVIVCIDVDDPAWTSLADHLMPNHDWQQYRDRGERPIARGSVLGLQETLAEMIPAIKDALLDQLPEGVARAVVLADGGGAVYHIMPVSELRHNYQNN